MKIDETTAAVITGGASGLGAATARLLATRGARVAIFDRNAEAGEALARETGGIFCEVDVTSDESVAAGLSKARSAHGQERILVNCAGLGGSAKTASRPRDGGPIREYPMDNFYRIIEVNLIGTFRCITKCAAGMLTLEAEPGGERGAIVNTASIAAQDGQIGQAAYAASKGGILGLTLPVARDLSNEGIRVNTIMPGIFDTPLLARAPAETRASLNELVPFPKRMGIPEEFGHLVLALIENAYINGEAVRLDGAVRMPPR